MTTKPSGNFRHVARYNSERETVDFILDFQHGEDPKEVPCRVSREALEDRARASGEVAPLDLYEQFRPEVWTAVDRRLKLGHFEPDGTILVRTGEVQAL